MTVSIFTRWSHFRRLIGINNNVAILFSDTAQHSNHIQNVRLQSNTSVNDMFECKDSKKPGKKISKAMLAYLQRAKIHDEFMKKEIAEYEIGKRHLANMMGEDPDFFTQADIDRSIEYLFPSGLFDPKARPMMRHPDEIHPIKKAAEFDESGRPLHSMFYTSKPNYYEVLYNIVDKMKSLNDIEDSLIKQGTIPKDSVNLTGSTWLTKQEIENMLLEKLIDFEYNYLITSLERLCDHPLSKYATDIIIKHRKPLLTFSKQTVIPPLEHDSTGRPYIIVKNCMRKNSKGDVTIWGNGSGKITINGRDITYFKGMIHREQVSQCLSKVKTKFIRGYFNFQYTDKSLYNI